ncbi:hypothetical protein Tco_0033444 [Tanacetum coccineum]
MKSLNMKLPSIVEQELLEQRFAAIVGYREKMWGMTKLDVAMKMWKRFVEVEVAAGEIEQQGRYVANFLAKKWVKEVNKARVPTSKPDPLRPNLGVLQVVSRAKVPETPASDEELEAPMEDQPLPADASPTALSAGYIADFNSEEDEEDPADHPADGGDNDNNESSNDDDDDDDDVRRIKEGPRRRGTPSFGRPLL